MMEARDLCRKLAAVAALCIGASFAVAADTGRVAADTRMPGIVDPLEDPPDELLHAADLRLRIVFSTGPFRQRSDGTYGRTSLVPVDSLVEQARGSTDPVVLDLLALRCGQEPRCDVLDPLRRWTEADRQNQLAWVRLAGALKSRGDAVAAREAFLTASRASMWHEHFDDVARLVVAAMPRDMPDDMRLITVLLSRSAAGTAVSSTALQTLGAYCKETDAVIRDACARIVATMVRDTGTTMPLTIAPTYAARAGVSDFEVAAYQQKSDAVHWALLQVVAADRSADPTTSLAVQERLLASGERGAAERYLVDHHIRERDAAARYVATLTDFQLKRRSESRSTH